MESACQHSSNEGVRLLAVKFVEKTVLMYTPDPNVPSDPPREATEGRAFVVFYTKTIICSMFCICGMMVWSTVNSL